MKTIKTGFPYFREINCNYGFERILFDGTINHYCCDLWYSDKTNDLHVSIYVQIADNLYCFMGNRKLHIKNNVLYVYYRYSYIKLEAI